MSTQGIKLTAIADAIRFQEGTSALIPANTFADRVLVLPVGVQNPSVALPAASTQEEQLSRIAAAIRAKEGSAGSIPAAEFSARILALEGGQTPPLPDGYTELEYVYTVSGTKYRISTGVTPSSAARIEAKVRADDSASAGILFGGAMASNGYYSVMIGGPSVSWRLSASTVKKTLNVNGQVIDIVLDVSKKTISFGGNTYSTGTILTLKSMYLFNYLSTGSMADNSFYGRLYALKIYNGDSIVRNFIPCISSSGDTGLYDSVNGVFYKGLRAGPAA